MNQAVVLTDASIKEFEARMQPSGTPLPLPVRMFIKLWVKPKIVKKSVWRANQERFTSETSKILKAIEGRTQEELTARVLVPPQQGLEDCSRHWSAQMALEHIVIVGQQIEMVVARLLTHQPINEKADLSKVKPLGQQTLEQTLAQFKEWALGLNQRMGSESRNSETEFYHPWFGDLQAKDWQWLLAQHQFIHRKQIQKIISRLIKVSTA